MDKDSQIQLNNNNTPASRNATILVDGKGLIAYSNQQACHIFGYEYGEMTGSELNKFMPEIDVYTAKEGMIIHQLGKHRMGHDFSLFFRINAFCFGTNQFFLIVFNSVKDQSRLKSAHAYHLNELVDLKYALDESTIVAFTDQRGIITYVNDKFCEVSKYSAEELIGKDHRMINSGYHSKEFMKELWQTIGNGEVWRGEIKNQAKDGSYYWVDTTIVPFLNEKGKPYKYLAIRNEITEYKQVVDELKKSVNELSDLKFALDASSIVAITDQKGIIHYVNDQFCRISKYSRDELIGKDHRIINSGYHHKRFFADLWRTIASGIVWKGEIKNRAKDGTYYWVDTTIVPFLDEHRRPYQYLAIRHEITKRKKAEEELQLMMTKIINVQEEERRRLSRELHDGIGQNLYSHLITINRLQSDVNHPLLDQMQDEAAEIIEELRDLSWTLRPSVLDDLGLIPAIRSFLVRFSDHTHINVYFDCYLNTRLNENKEITIYRIIQEALTNIRKYADTEEATVTIREMEDEVRVMIEDKGKGFDIQAVSRGVGLFSMEERAKAVKGNITIQSLKDKGTKIILDVPL
ncbi:PAS domain S-box protein [Cytobacillus sp.]|uniref:PAS domain S-box protein n=1 Tax=Cytobacillus sp. TaxID=2675269 RepID=UPI0028BD8ADE|nr:PAS domain S-box protein [Cytobacillus sp.]